MLYSVLLAALCIYRASASCGNCADPWDDCNESICEMSEDACSWTSSNYCNGEGSTDGITCCLSSPTTTEEATTTEELTTTEAETTESCPDSGLACSAYLTARCCPESDCTVSSSSICQTEDATEEDQCCYSEPTTTEEATTEAETTEAETTELETTESCPDDGLACSAYTNARCCPNDCITSSSSICQTEDATEEDECCYSQPTTTEEATTEAETTEAETTEAETTEAETTEAETTEAETTEAETTEAETTEAETTEAETTEAETTEAETTAAETTEAETTEAETTEAETTEAETTESNETTESPETTEEVEETETTEEESNKWPSPKPTLPSAEKWEMIHPAYKGSDGELLWHVYYGDFSNDDRFDSFRAAEKWNTKEIRPIIMKDAQFKRYRHGNSKKFKAESAVVTDNASSDTQSYSKWLIGVSAVLIVLFAAWLKFGNHGKKAEYIPLLQEEKVQYDQ